MTGCSQRLSLWVVIFLLIFYYLVYFILLLIIFLLIFFCKHTSYYFFLLNVYLLRGQGAQGTLLNSSSCRRPQVSIDLAASLLWKARYRRCYPQIHTQCALL